MEYPELDVPRGGERVLIVAPHMDDEAIGAGGYAIDAIAAGSEVAIVFLTAGDCNRFCARFVNRTMTPTPGDYLRVGSIRIGEGFDAGAAIGVPRDRVHVLGYPDGALDLLVDHPHDTIVSPATARREVPYEQAMSPGASHTLSNLLNDLVTVIDGFRPTTVIAPVPFDAHADHEAAAAIVDRALLIADRTPRRLGYLVHTEGTMKSLLPKRRSALLPPAHMRDYTWATYALSERVRAQKNAVLESHRSQLPYLYLLRNTFIRPNELFFVYNEERVVVPATARRPIVLAE